MPDFWDGLCHALPSQQVHLDCLTVCVVVTLTSCAVTLSCDTVRQLLQQVCLCCSALSTQSDPAQHQSHSSACWQSASQFPLEAGLSTAHDMTCHQWWGHKVQASCQLHNLLPHHSTQHGVPCASLVEQILCTHPSAAAYQVHYLPFQLRNVLPFGLYMVCVIMCSCPRSA